MAHNNLIVSYDLRRRPGEEYDYGPIEQAITDVDPYAVRILKTVWYLATDRLASDVGIYLRRGLRHTDPLIVVDAGHNFLAIWSNPDVMSVMERPWDPPGFIVSLPT